MKDQKEIIQNIAKFVEDNRELLEKGHNVEMAGLDKQVANLCESVLKLSDEERLEYADSFQELLHELTKLGEDLNNRKDAIANEIRYLSSHKKASVAYKVADAKAPLDEENE